MAKNAAEAQKREEETKDRAKAEAFYYQVFLTDSYAPMKKHQKNTPIKFYYKDDKRLLTA